MSGLSLHTSTVRFGPRIHGLEPDGPEPDIAMSGSSPSAAGMSGSGPKVEKKRASLGGWWFWAGVEINNPLAQKLKFGT